MADGYGYRDSVPEYDQRAFYYYVVAAELGFNFARYHCARCFLQTKLEEQDKVQLLQLFIHSGEYALIYDCELTLAKCYETGSGVRQSTKKATNHYKKAVDANQLLAERTTSRKLILSGLKGQKDLSLDSYYLLLCIKSDEHKNLPTNYDVKRLRKLEDYYIGEREFEKAYYLAKVLANHKDSLGYVQLAFFHEKGIFAEPSQEKANYYFSLAEEQGDRSAWDKISQEYEQTRFWNIEEALSKAASGKQLWVICMKEEKEWNGRLKMLLPFMKSQQTKLCSRYLSFSILL